MTATGGRPLMSGWGWTLGAFEELSGSSPSSSLWSLSAQDFAYPRSASSPNTEDADEAEDSDPVTVGAFRVADPGGGALRYLLVVRAAAIKCPTYCGMICSPTATGL